mgnify:CR=1 FL=1
MEFIGTTRPRRLKAFHSSRRVTGRANTCLGTHYAKAERERERERETSLLAGSAD